MVLSRESQSAYILSLCSYSGTSAVRHFVTRTDCRYQF